MRILDRYPAKQLVPVWVWCIIVFVFLSCVIDLFEHLDDILRYHVKGKIVFQYYLNFMPLVFVRASPIALLLSSAFISTRLVRYHELLAMSASGTSRPRASVPFIFVGWLIGLLVFAANELVVPRTTAIYERLRNEAFRGKRQTQIIENVTYMDPANRLYHARSFDPKHHELSELTILEHDESNRPRVTINARQAIYTPHGWLLLYGTISKLQPGGALAGNPIPFVERLIEYPVTPDNFRQSDMELQTLQYTQLREIVRRLRSIGITNVRRYLVEMTAKATIPLMSVIVCLIGFVGSTRQSTRGPLRGLGTSLLWGLGYYIAVAIGQGMGTQGLLPVWLVVWLPHVTALGCCVYALKRQAS